MKKLLRCIYKGFVFFCGICGYVCEEDVGCVRVWVGIGSHAHPSVSQVCFSLFHSFTLFGQKPPRPLAANDLGLFTEQLFLHFLSPPPQILPERLQTLPERPQISHLAPMMNLLKPKITFPDQPSQAANHASKASNQLF